MCVYRFLQRAKRALDLLPELQVNVGTQTLNVLSNPFTYISKYISLLNMTNVFETKYILINITSVIVLIFTPYIVFFPLAYNYIAKCVLRMLVYYNS